TITVYAPSHGTAIVETYADDYDVILYTPDSDYTGSDSFDYTISDGQGGESTVITVGVIVNTQPTAMDDEFLAIVQDSEDNILNVLINDYDLDYVFDGDPLTITEMSDPDNGTVTIDDNGTPLDPTDDVILYTPNFGYIGDDSFTYDISDGNGGIATGTVDITVSIPE
ncbi:MAG: cadherin-like domain-containing protein, partial [Deltaproteobacteria bacterium]|nr:cadherin-like domain-containing protein [Deltaproteobacteria bacterium]